MGSTFRYSIIFLSRILLVLLLLLLLLLPFCVMSQQVISIQVRPQVFLGTIPKHLWGITLEDSQLLIDGGLYGELIFNRSFEIRNPFQGWEIAEGTTVELNRESDEERFMKVVLDSSRNAITNKGYQGMGLLENHRYRLTFDAHCSDRGTMCHAQLINTQGDTLGWDSIQLKPGTWEGYEAVLTAGYTTSQGQLKLTFEGRGTVGLDHVSMFPIQTWKDRKNGCRKDLVERLKDLNPSFLRFPGGCDAAGYDLKDRYPWKQTLVPIFERPIRARWNPSSDRIESYQSLGMGFYEYFVLAEDLEALPLPVINSGFACSQFSGEQFVGEKGLEMTWQDIEDLVSFAIGDKDDPWGSVRAQLGHPEPFSLKYIQLGSHHPGEEYQQQFQRLAQRAKAKYPELNLIMSPALTRDSLVASLANFSSAPHLIEESWCHSPYWFAHREEPFRDYDRALPPIFIGEFRAQYIKYGQVASNNNWATALAEAIFLLGAEENSDIVSMVSYAPLLSHVNNGTAKQALIWFDQVQSVLTPNYHVQKMIAENKGTHRVEVASIQGQNLMGEDSLYVTSLWDDDNQDVILRIANVGPVKRSLAIHVEGVEIAFRKVLVQSIWSTNLSEYNSFESPYRISPISKEVRVKGDRFKIVISPFSFTVLRIPLKKGSVSLN